MKSTDISRECGSWWKFLNWSLWLLVFGWTTTIGYAQSDPAVLTLKEVLNDVHHQGIDAAIREEKNRLMLSRYRQREESRVQHTVTGRTGVSRNEVGDSLDLEASARESTFFTLSYEQRFETGFSWTASQTLRAGKTLTGAEDSEDYSKQLLIVRKPIYGREATLGELNARKMELGLRQTARKLDFEARSLEIEVARVFIEAWQYQEALQYRQRIIDLLQQKHDSAAQFPNRLAALEIERLNLEMVKEREIFTEQQVNRELASLRLAGFLAKELLPDLRVPAVLPVIGWSEETALKAFQAGSPFLAELESRAAMLSQDTELTRLSTMPEVQVGGFVGNTQVNDSQGSNYGLNLTLTYRFGGGEHSAAAAIRSESAILNLEIQKEKERIRLQYQADRNRYDARVRKITIEQKELDLMQKQRSLTRLRFARGDANREEMTEIELAIARKQLENLQAKVDCWEQYLNLVSGTSQPLSDLLSTPGDEETRLFDADRPTGRDDRGVGSAGLMRRQ